MPEPCPGCHARFDALGGPTDPYGGASAACWRAYGDVLAREFSDPAYFAAHQWSAHAYLAQHPSRRSRAAVQSVYVHLVALQLLVERGLPAATVGRALARLTASRPSFAWLTPPEDRGAVDVTHLAGAPGPEEHEARARRWAEAVWQAWAAHHATIRTLASTLL